MGQVINVVRDYGKIKKMSSWLNKLFLSRAICVFNYWMTLV